VFAALTSICAECHVGHCGGRADVVLVVGGAVRCGSWVACLCMTVHTIRPKSGAARTILPRGWRFGE